MMGSPSPHLCCAFLILFLQPALTAGAAALPAPARSSSCRDGSFWDDNMERCESCHSYCRHHAATGVTSQCQTLCSDYMKGRQCDALYFYDDGLETCVPCRDFCQAHRITGLTEECQKKCPDFMKMAKDDMKIEDAKIMPEESQSQSQPQPQSVDSSSSGHILTVVLPSLAVVVVVVAFVVGAVVMYKRGRPCRSNAQQTRHGRYRQPQEQGDLKYPQQPVGDDNSGQSGQHRLVPGGQGSCEDLSCTTQV